MDSGSLDHIFNSFQPTAKEDWITTAKHELGDVDPLQKLTIQKGGLTIFPYYDQQDSVGKGSFQLKPSDDEFLGARSWFNMPPIDVKIESESNQKALSNLNSGADGIFFKLKNRTTNISRLLEKIEWPYCALSFAGDDSKELLNGIYSHAIERKYNTASLAGCIFRDKPTENEIETIKLFENWNNFHALGLEVEVKETLDEEIGTTLAKCVSQIDLLTKNGISRKLALQSLAFKVEMGEDFFLNIAKLKTLRLLWNRISNAFDGSLVVPIFIHACATTQSKKEYQPHGNMLTGTTAALSAILGGCDALTIFPEDPNNQMMTRIARNVSSVLREESHLSKVADPTAGSYYLESLISQLSDRSWETFLKKVN